MKLIFYSGCLGDFGTFLNNYLFMFREYGFAVTLANTVLYASGACYCAFCPSLTFLQIIFHYDALADK